MKLNKNLKKIIYLNQEKKALLWENIQTWIKKSEKNVRISPAQRLNNTRVSKSPILKTNNKTMFATIFTTITILFTGGVSFAAQASLPGELLYPIKIHVNENIQSAFAVSAEAEANVQLGKIEERLEEKQELEAQWKLSVELENQINAQIEASKSVFYGKTTILENSNKSDTSIQLENNLDATLNIFWSSNTQTSTWETNNNSNVESDNSLKLELWVTGLWLDIQSDTSAESNASAENNLESNINNTSQWVLDTTISTQTEINNSLDSTIDAWINTGTNISTQLGTKANTKTDEIIDIVNGYDLENSSQADISISGSSKWSIGESWIESSTQSDINIDAAVDLGLQKVDIQNENMIKGEVFIKDL